MYGLAQVLDRMWADFLEDMKSVDTAVHLRSFSHLNPLDELRLEGSASCACSPRLTKTLVHKAYLCQQKHFLLSVKKSRGALLQPSFHTMLE